MLTVKMTAKMAAKMTDKMTDKMAVKMAVKMAFTCFLPAASIFVRTVSPIKMAITCNFSREAVSRGGGGGTGESRAAKMAFMCILKACSCRGAEGLWVVESRAARPMGQASPRGGCDCPCEDGARTGYGPDRTNVLRGLYWNAVRLYGIVARSYGICWLVARTSYGVLARCLAGK